MRSLVVIILLNLFLISCKNDVTKTNFLQKEDVQLVQPRIIASTMVIDSFVTIKVDRNMDGTTIFYSDDGTEPTKESIEFRGELKVKEPKELKFRAFHRTFKTSETASLKLYKKGHSPSSIKWVTAPNKKYNGSGETTLIDSQKGSLEFNTPFWSGFDTIAKATVNFEKKPFIKSIDIGYLNDPGSWIFPPSEIEIIVNNNKIDKLNFQLEPLAGMADRALMSYNVPINSEVSEVSIMVKNVEQIPDWHDGKGNKAWLFMDEWIFN